MDIDAIDGLIIKGKFGEVLSILLSHYKGVSSDNYKNMLLLASRHEANEKEYLLGTIEIQTYNLIRNQIAHSIIELVDEERGDSAFKMSENTPYLLFTYDVELGWKVSNFGRGPATKIIIAIRNFEGSWYSPVSIPPLGINQDFLLSWIGYLNVDILGAYYTDIFNNDYSTECMHDVNNVQRGNVFPKWDISVIKRHWM